MKRHPYLLMIEAGTLHSCPLDQHGRPAFIYGGLDWTPVGDSVSADFLADARETLERPFKLARRCS